RWTAPELAQQADSLDWQRSAADTPNLGLQSAPTWFALRLSASQDLTRLLEISYPVLNSLDIYLYRNGQLAQAVHTGSSRPFHSRPIAHRNYVIPLKIAADADHLLL